VKFCELTQGIVAVHNRQTDWRAKECAQMKTTKTREEVLTELSLRCSEGAGAAKRFERLVRRVIRTPKATVDARAKEWRESREPREAAS
jgi:hypothetical protein